jgi:hypothetical protein
MPDEAGNMTPEDLGVSDIDRAAKLQAEQAEQIRRMDNPAAYATEPVAEQPSEQAENPPGGSA